MTNENTHDRTDSELLDQARALSSGLAPERDLWPGIQNQLGEQLSPEEPATAPVVPLRPRAGISAGWLKIRIFQLTA